MHELMITQKIVEMIEEECQKHSISAKRALLEVGQDTTFKAEPILYYYKILVSGKELLSNCSLQIQTVAGDDVRLKEIED